MTHRNPNVEVFNQDALSNAGYLYTTTRRLSSQLATQRSTDVILQTGEIAESSVVDVGCGDGFYTIRFWDHGHPRKVIGVDAAYAAVRLAHSRRDGRPIGFVVGDVHQLPYPRASFDLALVQSILHHDDDPPGILSEAFRVARRILIHEPNGNNLGLKIIERISPYHVQHHEKSYTSRQIIRWVKAAGGRVVCERFAGFVPMFCPDWLARVMKALEPVVEHLPLIRALGSAVYVLVAERDGRE